MGRVLVGMLLGFLLAAPSAQAIRLPKPPTITDWTPSTFAQLNLWLEAVWQLTNGRYTPEATTINPNGSRRGSKYDFIVYDNAGSLKTCVNADGGTTWRCDASALTAP